MKYFIITLRLYLGSYEKYSKHLIMAKEEKDAIKRALTGECHDTPDFSEDDTGESCWDCGEFVYKLYDVNEIPKPTFDFLSNYLN